MGYQVSISPDVASQILAASSYLDGIQNGLGATFENEVEGILKSISANPSLYPKEFGPVRRALVSRFKQVVYYHLRGDVIVVLELRDARRRPPNWKAEGFHE